MAWIDPRFVEHQRKRFLRHDWERYMRHDWERFMAPDWRDPKHWDGGVPPAHLVELADRNARHRRAPSAEHVEAAEQEIEHERRALQKSIDALRLELGAIKRDLLLQKLVAKAYNPKQPRVSAGNPEGGQWTSDGSPNSGGIRLAGEIPTNDTPEVPKKAPSSTKERNRIARSIATYALLRGRGIFQIIGGSYWLYDEYPRMQAFLDPPRSLEELQQAVADPKYGYDIHHIVEKSSALEDGFPKDQVDGDDNLVRVPTYRHWLINAWYQTPNPDFGWQSPREYLRGKSWEERRHVGLDALIDRKVLKP